MDHEGNGSVKDRRVILLADDDDLVRNLVRTVLTKEGYSLLCAPDGEEALT